MEKFIFSSLKIFFWIFIGGIIKFIVKNLKIYSINRIINYIIDFIIFILVPYFVGINIWKYGLTKEKTIPIITLFFAIMSISYFITKYITKKYNFLFQEVFFPLTFMNTLYLGIPVTEYFVAPDAIYYPIIYSIIVTFVQFTLVIYIFKKNPTPVNLKPYYVIIYVSIMTFLLNKFKIELPHFIICSSHIISPILSPLMLSIMGYSIKWKNLINNIRLHIFTNLFKMVIIFIVSVIILYIFDSIFPLNKGFIKSIVLISILPSAIINYIILEKMKINVDFTIGEIFWGTFITIFLLPYFSEILEILLLIIK
ncbi:MAG: hypothetical protein RMJ67_05035 [Elusimicrobiota bacterium]|nr:hypothetical protein [Endomicrobiia bacterium]MDW8165853.1 hypothetical protein [Elusimicrobiota bacterium]